ncbi:unnamed protein product [Ectocarpus sp. CCAP 1310/34]|nr:unnamed protein product [Ectocarpus sp. CCAP 1310/34]
MARTGITFSQAGVDARRLKALEDKDYPALKRICVAHVNKLKQAAAVKRKLAAKQKSAEKEAKKQARMLENEEERMCSIRRCRDRTSGRRKCTESELYPARACGDKEVSGLSKIL